MATHWLRAPLYTPKTQAPSTTVGASYTYLPDALIGVDDRQRITDLEAYDPKLHQALKVDLLPPNSLVLPAFVDAHTHLPQWRVRACVNEDLLTWLQRDIWPEEARFADEAYARQVSEAFFKALKAVGTQTIGLWNAPFAGATHIAFEVASQQGLRLVSGLNLMDQAGPEALLSDSHTLLAQSEALARRWHRGAEGHRYALMPRFALNTSRPLLQGLGRLMQAKPEWLLHTHLAEQQVELEAVAAAFPEAEHYVDVYDQFGLVGANSLFAHSIHLNSAEVARLKQAQAALVHCPSANFFLKSGRFRWDALGQAGFALALGSDVGAGTSPCMRSVMRDAYWMQAQPGLPTVSVHDLLRAATLGGAEALGAAQETGSLEVGKRFEALCFTCEEPLWQASELGEAPGPEQAALTQWLTRLILCPEAFSMQWLT